MATKRSKKCLSIEKERILSRLREIEDDRNYIVQHVNKHFEQAESAAASLLNETSRGKFLKKHHAVTQTLNDCWREIFRVKSYLVDSKDGEEESSSSSDESIGSMASDLSVSTFSSTHLLERSNLSGTRIMSPTFEECPVVKTGLQTKITEKQLKLLTPIFDAEKKCAGDHCVSEDQSSCGADQTTPLSSCGDGLKHEPLPHTLMKAPSPSNFPNVNCSVFVSSVNSHFQVKNENGASNDLTNASFDLDCNSTAGDINSWALQQSKINQDATVVGHLITEKLNLCESHSDGDESLNNSNLSEQSIPSDRTVIGAPTLESINVSSSSEQLVSRVNLSERKGTCSPVNDCSNSATVNNNVENNTASPLYPVPAPAIANRCLISYESSTNSTCSSSSTDIVNKLRSHTASAESLVSSSNDSRIENLVLKEGSCIEGIVTALTSPTDLWIQVQDEHLGGLLEELSSFCGGSKSEAIGKELTEGHFCCAKCTNDDSWNRAVVQKIRYKPAMETNTTGAPKFIVDSVDVRYIDYGNSETLALDRLRRLRPKFVKLPAQAVCCLLDKLKPHPSHNEDWIFKVTNELKEIVFGQEVRATLLQYCPGFASTIRLAVPDKDIEDVEDVVINRLETTGSLSSKGIEEKKITDEPIQVSSSTMQDDGKLAAKAAAKRMTDEGTINYTSTEDKADEIRRENFKCNAKIEKLIPDASDGFFVMISHVNSPSSFYGHVLPDASCYDALQDALDETYMKFVDLKAPIPSAVSANTCWGTRFTDGRWYRVRVIEGQKAEYAQRRRRRISISPAEEKVYVEYIDYGNRDWVSVEALRPLLEEHCQHPGLAVHMRLAHIFPPRMTPEQSQIPPSDWRWSDEAIGLFNQMIGSDETLLARFVKDDEELDYFGVIQRQDSDPFTIMLWDGSSSTNKIINMEMVNASLAMSLKYGPEIQTGNRTANPARDVYRPVRKHK